MAGRVTSYDRAGIGRHGSAGNSRSGVSGISRALCRRYQRRSQQRRRGEPSVSIACATSLALGTPESNFDRSSMFLTN